MTNTLPRVIVLWIPDWPIHAFVAEAGEHQQEHGQEHGPKHETEHPLDTAAGDPVALVSQQRVIACSPAARMSGVRIGQRERDAQSFCPRLAVHAHDPDLDERHFSRVLDALEDLIPGVESVRPGTSALRARGPARYFGSEALAAEAILRRIDALGYRDARVGIACGKFAAEQVARSPGSARGVTVPTERTHVLPEHDTVSFLGALPIARACGPDLATTLQGLGIHRLEHLAALPEDAVRERFGLPGITAYRLATAQPGPYSTRASEVTPRTPPVDLTRGMDFEPPLDSTEQLAFACSTLADEVISALRSEQLVCTELRIELTDETGVRHEREWSHPRQFDGPEILNRLRWHVAALSRDLGRGGAGIARVQFTPTRTDRAAAHEPGLWSSEPDARVNHHLQRVQSLLGHEGVVTAELSGGRLSRERTRFIPWGTGETRGTQMLARRPNAREGPWPGHLKGPLPSTVFRAPLAAELSDAHGVPVRLDTTDLLETDPSLLGIADAEFRARVTEWSAPWPLRERWWRAAPTRFRMQVVCDTGDAWLLLHENGTWFAEGRYD